MLGIIIVVAPILFVLLTTMAILSFAPVEEESSESVAQSMDEAQSEQLNQGEGAQIILFRPAAVRHKAASADDLVAHLEQELRQRHQYAQNLADESSKGIATGS